MLQNTVDRTGCKLAVSDGDIGHVKDFYCDNQSWTVRYLVAGIGTWLTGDLVLQATVCLACGKLAFCVGPLAQREPIPAVLRRIPGRSPVFLVSSAAIMLIALAFSGCGSIPRGMPASDGLLNFGQVNDALFRGAQPDESGIASLQRLGVRTIINLRLPGDTWTGEEASARAHDLVYVSLPLRGMGAPTDAQVAQILAFIESSPPPVFIHCEHGADRTGTIIACYRLRHHGWSAAAALTEAKIYGFSAFQIGMRRFIRNFSLLAPAPSARDNHDRSPYGSAIAPSP